MLNAGNKREQNGSLASRSSAYRGDRVVNGHLMRVQSYKSTEERKQHLSMWGDMRESLRNRLRRLCNGEALKVFE